MNSPLENLGNLSVEARARLERTLLKRKSAGSDRIPRRTMTGPSPMSSSQLRLWFLDQFDPGTPIYNISRAFRLVGNLDRDALQYALNTVVQRHESLRTTFTVVKGEAKQQVGESWSVPISFVDLSHMPDEERTSVISRLSMEEARKPFNLARDFMLRCCLHRLSQTEHVLQLSAHHIAADAWSMEILLREISVCYAAALAGHEPNLPNLPIQYADFSIWQNEKMRAAEIGQELEFWRAQLRGAPPVLQLPTDFPRPAALTYEGARITHEMPPELVTEVQEFVRKQKATLFMALVGAFQTMLARYSGQEEVVIGSPVAGRHHVDTENLIGLFVNTIALRTNLADDPTFQELVARVRAVTLDAYSHQKLPFEKLVEELKPRRNLNQSPVFQVMFSLQNTLPAVLDLPGLTISAASTDTGTSKFDLTFFLVDQPDGLVANIEYNTNLYRPETIERMMQHYQRLLKNLVAHPDRPISTFSL